MPAIAVLGPQQPAPSIAPVLERLGVGAGELCVVTAGWQEREGELDELVGHVGRPCRDLELYQLAETAFAADHRLFDAYRARQERLRFLQSLYRTRLDHAIAAARAMLAASGDTEVVQRERRSAINAVRNLDRQHLRHIRDVHAAFDAEWDAAGHPLLSEMRRRLQERIEASAAVLVAGGHVSVLVNRIRMFGIAETMAQRPIVAWSAGAMALARRVVLFHDSPPQGAGHAEVFDSGLGLLAPLLPLPHGRSRLRLDDRERVALMARRFGPEPAVTLDIGACLVGDASEWHAADGCERLTARGRVEPLTDASVLGGRR